jgi:hypothetical protein
MFLCVLGALLFKTLSSDGNSAWTLTEVTIQQKLAKAATRSRQHSLFFAIDIYATPKKTIEASESGSVHVLTLR